MARDDGEAEAAQGATHGASFGAASRAEAALDPEIRAFVAASELDYPADASIRSVAEQRRFYDAMCARFRAPRPAGLRVTDSVAPGPAGPVPLRRYHPNDAARGVRVVYFHGGGFFLGGIESHDDVCAELAVGAGVELISVDYRLAPEHPFPAAFEDALAATLSLGKAATPLILAGDSVGGGLAAGISWALRRQPGARSDTRSGARIKGSVLIYPSLAAGRQVLPSYEACADAPLFTREDARRAVRTYAGAEDPSRLALDPRFSPLAASGALQGVAPCQVIAVDPDPTRDDGLLWTALLREAGVAADGVLHEGLPHGCLRARHRSAKARLFFKDIVAALRRFRNM